MRILVAGVHFIDLFSLKCWTPPEAQRLAYCYGPADVSQAPRCATIWPNFEQAESEGGIKARAAELGRSPADSGHLAADRRSNLAKQERNDRRPAVGQFTLLPL